MKPDFCNSLVTECTGQGSITFPSSYEGGLDYCEVHAGSESDEFYWSFPFDERESIVAKTVFRNQQWRYYCKPNETIPVASCPFQPSFDRSRFWRP